MNCFTFAIDKQRNNVEENGSTKAKNKCGNGRRIDAATTNTRVKEAQIIQAGINHSECKRN